MMPFCRRMKPQGQCLSKNQPKLAAFESSQILDAMSSDPSADPGQDGGCSLS